MSDSPIESTKAEMSFDPHCEDCCDPVTPCLVHTPRVALSRGAEPENPDFAPYGFDEDGPRHSDDCENGYPGICHTCLGKPLANAAGEADELRDEFARHASTMVRLFDGLLAERDDAVAAAKRLLVELDRLERVESYVCQVIAMGNQADLTVEKLPK